MACRLEPTHDLLAFSGLPVGIFNSVVQPLVRPVIGIRSDGLDRPHVATQFVRHDHARLTKLPDQPGEEASGGPAVAASLNQDIENIAIGIDGAPEPELPAANRNDGLIHVPLVTSLWSIPTNAIGIMTTKAVDPEPNSFPADDHPALGEQILHVGRAQGKAVVGLDRIGDDLTRKAKPLQPG